MTRERPSHWTSKHILSVFILLIPLHAGGGAAALSVDSNGSDTAVFDVSLDSGVAAIDEDIFIPILVELAVTHKSFELVLSGPFRLRVADRNPQDSKILREQDWDEHSDWARIIRRMRYARQSGTGRIDLTIGELNGVHQAFGEIVSHYYNSVDMDHYHGGFDGGVEFNGNGLTMRMDDIISPAIMTGYMFVSPIAWFSDSNFATRLKAGAQIFVDWSAPNRTSNRRGDTLIAAVGSISLLTVQRPKVELTTYVSVGGMDGDAGFHGGIVVDSVLSKRNAVGLHFQTEFRYVGEDYFPSLLNPFYDHNRRFFTADPVTGRTNTFTDHLSNTSMNLSAAPGFMADMELQVGSAFKLGLRYDFQARHRPHWVLFRVEFAPTDHISLRAFYAGQDIEGGQDVFSLNALAGAAYQHQIIGPLRAFAEFARKFRTFNNDTAAMANEMSLGGGLVWTW